MRTKALALAASLALWAGALHAQTPPAASPPAEMIVEKRTFEMPAYTTVGGKTIKGVKVGWEAYGQPNADRSNVILVTHFFSGTSHAAGKYAASEKAPGYWDSIIGPGKAIDTNTWYVISSDTLVNLNANTPNVVTTGPASIDPDTGKPYGTTFPVVTMRDFVNVQKALLDSLGVKKVKAVVGASMGALQAYEWAAAYPEMVERIVPVIGAAGGDAFLTAWLDVWAQPIRLDPKWRGGQYDPKDPPKDGLIAALKVISLHANQSEWANKTFGAAPADEAKKPIDALENRFRIEAALETGSAGRAAGSDANHLLYLAKANQLTAVDPGTIKVPALLIYTPTDLVFPPERVERTAAAIKANGTLVETLQITGPNGHLNGVLHIAQAGPKIAEFLRK